MEDPSNPKDGVSSFEYVNMGSGDGAAPSGEKKTKAKRQLRHCFKRTIMPIFSLVSNAILPLLSIVFYSELIYHKSEDLIVWITLAIDVVRFLVCGYYAVLLFCCRSTDSTHGLAKSLRVYAKIIEKKTLVRFVLLIVTAYSLIIMSTKVSPDPSTALLAYERDLEDRTKLAGLFFAKVALFFGQQLIQNFKGMEYGVNYSEWGGHSPKVNGEMTLTCLQDTDNKFIRSYQAYFDAIIASMIVASICLGILLLPHLYFLADLSGLNGPSYAKGLPVSASISRLARFPYKCPNSTSCLERYYGLQEVRVMSKEELEEQVEANLPISDKVLMLDYQSSNHVETTTFVNLGLTFPTPTKISSIGVVARVPQISSNKFRVCVEGVLFPNNPPLGTNDDDPVDDYALYGAPLESIGKFVVGLQQNDSDCMTNFAQEDNSLGFFNVVLEANATGKRSSQYVSGLVTFSQSNLERKAISIYSSNNGYVSETWVLGADIKAFVQEFIDGYCVVCSPLFPIVQVIVVAAGVGAITLLYAIFSVILPWPRIRLNVFEVFRCCIYLVAFPAYILWTAVKHSKQQAHVATQHMAILLFLPLLIVVMPIGWLFDQNYSRVLSFITQTKHVSFEMNKTAQLPDPSYFSVNAICNGVYGCVSTYYLAQAFVYVTFSGFLLFVGGQLFQFLILLLLSLIGWILLRFCGCLKYCCVDLKWLAQLRQMGDQLVYEHEDSDTDSSD